MAIKFGTSSISNVMLGSTQVSKVYIGSSLVWEYIVSLINYALGSNGSTAQASSVNNPLYEPSNCINGNRSGSGWLDGTGGWTSDTPLPQWIQVDFPAIRSISEMDVFTIQDNYSSPSEPTESMTFSLYGVTSCSVQYWNGSAWTNLGSSSGDYHVWKKYTFGAVVTQGIRVNVTGSTDGWPRQHKKSCRHGERFHPKWGSRIRNNQCSFFQRRQQHLASESVLPVRTDRIFLLQNWV